MRLVLAAAAIAATVFGNHGALAGERTIRLSVPAMNCAICPYIVRQAILTVEGVRMVEASLENRSATVVFDDAVTSAEAISKATVDIGYASVVVEAEEGS
jgi:periplasmic mercuric ion binding protein